MLRFILKDDFSEEVEEEKEAVEWSVRMNLQDVPS